MAHHLASYALRLAEAWNSHEPNRVIPYYAEDYEGVDIGESGVQHGRGAVEQLLERYWRAFPDLRVTILGTVTEGDRIAVSWLAGGTQLGPIMHIPATGRRMEIRGVSILHIRDGLVTHGEYVWDLAGMLRHMGLLPEL